MNNVDIHSYINGVELVGRIGETEIFRSLLLSTFGEGAKGLLISGPPGIGKSRLLHEYHRIAFKEGHPVALFRFREHRRGTLLNVWGHLTEVLTSRGPSLLPAYAVFEQFMQAVRNTSASKSVCVLLDDIQFASAPFLEELVLAMDELAPLPIFLAAAFRDLPVDRSGTFLNFLSDIRRLPYVEELRLGPLEESEVHRVMQKTIGRSFSEGLGHKVFDLSGGNPLFVQEISRTLRSHEPSNTLNSNELWKIEVPKHIRTAISRRFERISSDCRTLIQKLALLGAHFSREEVRLVIDLDNLTEEHRGGSTRSLIACLEEAYNHGLIVSEHDSQHYRFTHEVIREAIHYTTPAEERARLCRAMAEQIEKKGLETERLWASRLAEWWGEASETDAELHKSRRYALKAAEYAFAEINIPRCRVLLDWPEAETTEKPRTIEEADRLYLLGQIESYTGNPATAIDYYKLSLKFYLENSVTEKIERNSDFPVHNPVAKKDMAELFEDLLEGEDCEGVVRGLILVHYATALLSYAGDYSKAERVMREAEGVCKKTGNEKLRLKRLLTASMLDYHFSRFNEGLRKLARASDIVERRNDIYSLPHVLIGRCILLINIGRTQEAMEVVEPLLDSVRHLGNSYNYFMPYVVAAKVKMLNGNFDIALDHIKSGLLYYPYNDVLLNLHIHIDYLLGHIEEGDKIRKYLRTIHRRTNSPPSMYPIYYASLDTIRALCTGEYDELPESAHKLRSLIASPMNHPFILVRAHLLLCLIASLLDDVNLATEHFRRLRRFEYMHLIRPYYRLRALARSAHCLGQHEKAVHLMDMALSSARFYHDRPMVAVLNYESAEIRFGEEVDGTNHFELRALLSRATAAAREMGMKPLERRAVEMLKKVETNKTTGASIHFHLTKREKEIVHLVGEGLSNADIAAELHISLYTVSNHMSNILKKTGARNRVAAYAIVQKQHRTSGL